MRIQDMSVRTKLLGGFALVIIIALAAFSFITLKVHAMNANQQVGMETVHHALDMQDTLLRVTGVYTVVAGVVRDATRRRAMA